MPDTTTAAPLSRRLDAVIGAVKGHERWLLALGCALQLAVLVVMIASRGLVLLRGDVYSVRVVPVDPRDLLRGDYVILSYEFSRVPPQGIEGLPPDVWQNRDEYIGRTVYAWLEPEPDGKHWRAGRLSVIAAPAGQPFLRGRLVNAGRIEYGIESYFVQEGKGHPYEAAARSGTLSAEIAIDPDGQAVLRGLKIEK